MSGQRKPTNNGPPEAAVRSLREVAAILNARGWTTARTGRPLVAGDVQYVEQQALAKLRDAWREHFGEDIEP